MTKKTSPTKTEELNADQAAGSVEGEILSAAVESETPPAEAATSQAVATISEDQVAAVGAIIGGISTEQLKQALEVQKEQRELIKQFIQSHLIDGTDFGRIHVVKRDKCPKGNSCTNDYHFSKRVLFKPGQEKLFSLFQITDKLERDEETYQMLGENTSGLVAYKCTLYRAGNVIGHGRGCASVGESSRDANSTIKIAEKRARMDACLSLGFSEYFAQDLDDPDYRMQAEMSNQRAAEEAERRHEEELKRPVSDETRTKLARWMNHRGFTTSDLMVRVLQINGVPEPATMTEGQAQDIVRKLYNNMFTSPMDLDIDDIGIGDLPDVTPPPTDDPQPAAANTEAQLVVDDDFRSQVHIEFTSLGLNAKGEMWFKKYVTGRPFGSWDDFTDEEWRKAYSLINDISTQAIEVEERYIRGLVQ